MTIPQLIYRVSRKTNEKGNLRMMHIGDTERCVNLFFATLAEKLGRAESIQLKGFGGFEMRLSKKIRDKMNFRFKPGETLSREVQKTRI